MGVRYGLEVSLQILHSRLRTLTLCSYCLQWLFILPLEIIAGAFTISYWNEHLPKAIFVAIFLLSIVVINLFGIKGYGEAEFVFSIIKVTAVIGFMYAASPSSSFTANKTVSLLSSSTLAASPTAATSGANIGTTPARSTTGSRASALSSSRPPSRSLEPS